MNDGTTFYVLFLFLAILDALLGPFALAWWWVTT